MDNKISKFSIEVKFKDGYYKCRLDWEECGLDMNITVASSILALVAHQLIDLQDEQDQHDFEKSLMSEFKREMKNRFNNIETDED